MLLILALLVLIYVLAFIAWISYQHHKYSHIPGPKRDKLVDNLYAHLIVVSLVSVLTKTLLLFESNIT